MTTQTIDVGENHYTNSTAPSTWQALTNIVHASTVLKAFFKFAIPASPANETLTLVELVVMTSSAGDSVGNLTANLCATTWDENTITWNTNPAQTTLLASFQCTAISTVYRIPLNTAAILALVNSTMSLAVNNDNADSVQFWGSRYNIDTTKRPDLVLTYTPNTTYATTFTALRAQGYTGSLSDMRRQNLLALLSLTEPQFKTNNDLEFQYLRSIGKTGTLNDMRKQP